MKAILATLAQLQQTQNFRSFYPLCHDGKFVWLNQKKLLNFASNDYLGLAANKAHVQNFLHSQEHFYFSSSSSRSLSGNFEIYEAFESHLASLYGKEALLFNSGYHANVGIISSLARLRGTLFVVDKSIHASHLDGLKGFLKIPIKRYAHNDMQALEQILSKQAAKYERIIILTEALFSMEGDFCPLKELIRLKEQFPNLMLYIDEAHSIGSYGEDGLGLVWDWRALEQIDFLVLTFGKALGSMGACVLCNEACKQYFINHSRSLIYSTALPPINVAMSFYNFLALPKLKQERNKIKELSIIFKKMINKNYFFVIGDYNILSIIIGDNHRVSEIQSFLEEHGYFVPAIKSPTVPKNKSCLRFLINASMEEEEILHLCNLLNTSPFAHA